MTQKTFQYRYWDQSTDISKRFPNGASKNAQNIPSTKRRCVKIHSKEKYATCNGRYQSRSGSKRNNTKRRRNFPDKILILKKLFTPDKIPSDTIFSSFSNKGNIKLY